MTIAVGNSINTAVSFITYGVHLEQRQQYLRELFDSLTKQTVMPDADGNA